MGERSAVVETEGARLYVEEAGDGQAVVFLHPACGIAGRGTSSSSCSRTIPRAPVRRSRVRPIHATRARGRLLARPRSPRGARRLRDRSGRAGGLLDGRHERGRLRARASRSRPRARAVAAGVDGFEGTPEQESAGRPGTRSGTVDRPGADAGDRAGAGPTAADDVGHARHRGRGGPEIREIAFDNLHELTMDESAASGSTRRRSSGSVRSPSPRSCCPRITIRPRWTGCARRRGRDPECPSRPHPGHRSRDQRAPTRGVQCRRPRVPREVL